MEPERTRVLVANEPRAYREVIAAAMRCLRPHLEVIVVEPHELDDAVAARMPHVVLCSRFAEAREAPATWVTLYPDGDNRAVVTTGGTSTTIVSIDLDGLLALVDDSPVDGVAPLSV